MRYSRRTVQIEISRRHAVGRAATVGGEQVERRSSVATTPSAFKSAAQAGRSCVTWRRRAADFALRPLSRAWIDDGACRAVVATEGCFGHRHGGHRRPHHEDHAGPSHRGRVPSRLLVTVRGFLGASGCCPVAQLLYHARVPPAPHGRRVPPGALRIRGLANLDPRAYIFVRRRDWLGLS